MPKSPPSESTQFDEGHGAIEAFEFRNSGSAISYIPEAVWNESSGASLAAAGGGASVLYGKPIWQIAPGVPAADARNVPDVSFSAAGHDAYLVEYNGVFYGLGGTSCSSPSFAGELGCIIVIIRSARGYQTSAGLGNINPQLYRLAQTAPSVFHDTVTGSNAVNCAQGTSGCATGSIGYQAAAGYDRASGLGSLDANNLFTQWNSQSSGVTVYLFVNAASTTVNATVGMTATVVPNIGAGPIPTGAVSFSFNGEPLGTSTLRTISGKQEADLFFPAYLLGGTGSFTLSAEYAGDTVFSGGGTSQAIRITAPRGAAAVVPSAPNSVSSGQLSRCPGPGLDHHYATP